MSIVHKVRFGTLKKLINEQVSSIVAESTWEPQLQWKPVGESKFHFVARATDGRIVYVSSTSSQYGDGKIVWSADSDDPRVMKFKNGLGFHATKELAQRACEDWIATHPPIKRRPKKR